ncbi:MAG TPA: magnesium-translocating P-type ATPase [Caulobacterales bacterium]|nr:magnesium-translocating P-type ATPase [Caulobacterales bacterium]
MDSPYWSQDAASVMRALEARPEGLSSAEAEARLARDGANALQEQEKTDALQLLLRQFASPLVLILVIGSSIALLLREWTEAGVILAIVLGSTVLGFAQEYRASKAVDALRKRLALSARVLRDGAERDVPFAGVVRGDIVLLSAGDLIPADGVILEAADFLVTEASLTGETFPVEKKPGACAPQTPLAQRGNCAFAGASVRSGAAKVLICATGKQTVLGGVAAHLRMRDPETEFSKGLRRFGYLLLRVMIVLVVFVLIINQVLGRPFLESLLFSVALAVGLSPELLPAIVSVTLSAGAREMAKEGVLVRRLEAIENLGEIDVLCTDKTGTLTRGVAALEGALDVDGALSPDVMQLAYLNAAFETGIENPLDAALVAAGQAKGLVADDWAKVDEIPYDFERKRLTIVVEKAAAPGGDRLIVAKGAFDNVIDVCTEAKIDGAAAPLDEAVRAKLNGAYRAFGERGLRVLGVATRIAARKADYTRDDESAMCFIGFLTFADPPKPDARDTIAALRAKGLKIKIITGDNRHVAAHVAEAMGLDPKALLTGEDVDALKGVALAPIANKTDVFAEVEPQHKERIVKALQQAGHAVGYLGDGINDAPALHAADVGVSVDQAVDVARAAADVILLKQDLGVLKRGLESGRKAFANTLKYICITTGSSFGNMVSMALATPLLPFLPLTATQVLVTNFLSDLPLMAVAGDNVDQAQTDAPQRWRVRDIQSFMLVFGLLSSVFDLATFFVLVRVVHADAELFQTVWFVVSVLTEIAALLILRTRLPAWTSAPGRWVAWLSLLVVAVTLAAPYLSPLKALLELQAPSLSLLTIGCVIVLAYAASTEAAKVVFYRRASAKR